MELIAKTLNDLVVFLKNPIEKQDERKPIKYKIKIFLILLVIDFIVVGITMGIAAIIESFGLINLKEHYLYDLFGLIPVWLFLLSTAIIVPFIEELIFRLPLRFKYNYFLRFILLLAYISGKKNKIRLETWLKNQWSNHFSLIFYLFSVLFAIIHLTNYNFSITIIIFAPILVFSQFTGGLLIGYLRVRYSFVMGFILHAVFNGILISVSLISMSISGGAEKLNIDYVNYSLIIIEPSPSETESSSHYSSDLDTIIFNAVPMKQVISYLVDRNEHFVMSNDAYKLDTKITLKFVNHKVEKSEVKGKILKHLSNTYNFIVEHPEFPLNENVEEPKYVYINYKKINIQNYEK